MLTHFRASLKLIHPNIKTKLIFLFLRLHRLQRLYNIELGGRGIRELTLDANKTQGEVTENLSTSFARRCSLFTVIMANGLN